MKRSIPFLLLLAVALAACGGAATSTGDDLAATSATGGGVLPPEPQEITFTASDGQELTGFYYPAAVNPAPVVVFMHWVGGDKSDWYELAPWLQNRGLENPFENPGVETWWDPSWFPAVPEGASYGVFLFSFRGCSPYNAGCPAITPAEWLLDAQAAMETARGLAGVDPTRVAAIGASIGADGAPDGCAWLNEQYPGSCRGALSLSPGGYLGLPYADVVGGLGDSDPATAAWCVADETEYTVCETAASSGNGAYQSFKVPGGSHGNRLLEPELEPLPMQLILDFLAAAFPG